jgi:hypothetical protein
LLYMVVEGFRQGAAPVYARAAEQGRLLPAGVRYLESWVDERMDRCFQLMQADDMGRLHDWTASWGDVVEFEIVPVITSGEAVTRVLGDQN